MYKTSITKSRAGHYTVAIRNQQGIRVFIEDKINTLDQARAIISAWLAKTSNV